jgi:hypothetical protein
MLLVMVVWGMVNQLKYTKLNRLYEQQIERRSELNEEYSKAIERINDNSEKSEEINERLITDLDDLRLRVLHHLELKEQ